MAQRGKALHGRARHGPARQGRVRQGKARQMFLRQRKPRVIDKKHKGLIAQLPCVICHVEPVQVAHIRYASAEDDADVTGAGRKPDDWRVLPLCPRHHMYGKDAQHSMGEEEFWRGHGINPFALAKALFKFKDVYKMDFLVRNAKTLFPARKI